MRNHSLTLLCLAVFLTGCARSAPEPVPTPLPTPQSQQISEFILQRDGDYGYGMLRPAGWMAANEGTGRVYFPNPQNDQMRFALNIANLKVISSQLQEGAEDVRWTLYLQRPNLEGWTDALVQALYQRDEVHLERSLEHARVYSVRTPKFGQHIRLVAYVIDQSTPFELIFNVGGEQAKLEALDQAGLVDDFITMVESFHAAP